MDKTHPQTKARLLRKAGFDIPKTDWMRANDAIRLQRQIDRAVKAAADEVAQHTGGKD